MKIFRCYETFFRIDKKKFNFNDNLNANDFKKMINMFNLEN